MKITKELTLQDQPFELEAALTEKELKEIFAEYEIPNFSAELDVPERVGNQVQMASLSEMLSYCKAAGIKAVLYDVTHFPHADEKEAERQVKQLAEELQLDRKVIRQLCVKEIQEYLALDRQRNTQVPVHSIVEGYTNGTTIVWHGVNEYPLLKKIILEKLQKGGNEATATFARRAAEMQMDLA